MRSLVDLGDEVICYGSAMFADSVRATGAKFTDIHFELSKEPQAVLANPRELGSALLAKTIDLAGQLTTDLSTIPADYVVSDSWCLWGRVAAVARGLPLVTVYPGIVLNEQTLPAFVVKDYFDSDKATLDAGLVSKFDALTRSLSGGNDRIHADLASILLRTSSALNIVYCSKQLQPRIEVLSNAYRFVGAALRSSEENDVALLKGLRKPLIYVALGTVVEDRIEFIQLCIDTFRASRFDVLISLGARMDPARLGPIPPNVHLRERVPQLSVLRIADVFITHGGMNSVNEAVYFGVPLVVYPQFGDQWAIAAQVLTNKLGSVINPNSLNRDYLLNLIERTLGSAEISRCVSRLSTEFRQAEGGKAAAREIRTFVASSLS
jgi:MGT family glycosyltransferase